MVENGSGKILPQNLDAETAVIGAILAFPDCLNDVIAITGPDYFYRDAHAKIFRTMMEHAERGDPIDVLTLSDSLKTKNELDSVGGVAYLASCHDSVPTAVNVGHYARIVKRSFQQRQLVRLFTECTERAYVDDPLVVASEITSELLRINPANSSVNVWPIDKLVTECLKDLEEAYHSNGRIIGVPTGLQEFEKYFGGISRRDLVVVGGRTSHGKSSFAGTVAKNTAALGYPVVFVSAESDPKKIVMRLLSQASQVENIRLQVGMLGDSDFSKITVAAGRVANLPMTFFGGLRSWETIKALLRALKLREPNLSLVVVDYAQLLSAPVAENKRYLEVSKISAEAKGLALEFNAAVMLLSQLSRDVEKNQNKPGQGSIFRRPRLSDLRESGSLEQDADIVFLLHRERMELKEPTELIIAKNREGRIGSVKLRFDEKTVSFSDWIEPETSKMRAAGQ